MSFEESIRKGIERGIGQGLEQGMAHGFTVAGHRQFGRLIPRAEKVLRIIEDNPNFKPDTYELYGLTNALIELGYVQKVKKWWWFKYVRTNKPYEYRNAQTESIK